MNRTLFIALVTVLAACKKAPEPEMLAEAVEVRPTATTPVLAIPANREVAIERMVANFSRVQFGFDQHEIDEAALEALDANARIMAAFPRLQIEIQGHADERGTTEYNLALGERRAKSVHDRLVMMGVSPDRLTAMSFGEEVPLDRAGGDTAFSANRRAEFRITVADDYVRGTTE